jgi:hypothetical protein
MNEDELSSLLNTLEQGLIQDGLSSLVNQERISAVEGKAEELTAEDVAELRYEWSQRGMGRAPRVRADDVRIRPLTVGERLAELLDLVEAAVGGTYAIEMRLRNDLKAALDVNDVATWSGEVVFGDPPESELSGAPPQEWTLPDQPALQQRGAAVRDVILRINQLREQAELPRSERLHSVTAPDDGSTADFDMPGDWS